MNRTLLALIVINFFTLTSKSQDMEPPNVIKTNPFAMLWTVIPFTGELRIVYEKAIIQDHQVKFKGVTRKHAIMVAASYLGASPLFNLDNIYSLTGSKISTNGFRGQFAYKFYITHKEVSAPRGFYIAPHISYAYAKFQAKDNIIDYLSVSKANGNLLFGYQVIGKKVFAYDIFTGIGYKVTNTKLGLGESLSNFNLFGFNNNSINSGMKFSFGMNIGVAFGKDVVK